MNEFLPERIKKVQSKLKNDHVDGILVRNPLNVFYLTAVKADDAFLLITKSKNYFFVDLRSYSEVNKALIGFEVVVLKNFKDDVEKVLKQKKINKLGFESNYCSCDFYESMKDKFLDFEIVPLKNYIEDLRHIKDEYEIYLIRKSAKLTKKLFKILTNALPEAKTEKDLERVFLKRLIDLRNVCPSFDIIIANGVGTSVPHHITSEQRINYNDITLIDMGVLVNSYASDFTFMILPEEARKNQEILKTYNLVKQAQKKAILSIKEGVLAKDVYNEAFKVFAKAKVDKYFTHSLGHSVGLEVHDGLSLGPNSDFKLKEGMVFTIEPGLYFPGKFGIRLETMVVVRKDHVEEI